jgi:hypothetical protein
MYSFTAASYRLNQIHKKHLYRQYLLIEPLKSQYPLLILKWFCIYFYSYLYFYIFSL